MRKEGVLKTKMFCPDYYRKSCRDFFRSLIFPKFPGTICTFTPAQKSLYEFVPFHNSFLNRVRLLKHL